MTSVISTADNTVSWREDLAHAYLKAALLESQAKAALDAEKLRLAPLADAHRVAKRDLEAVKDDLVNALGEPGAKWDDLDTVKVSLSNPKPVTERVLDRDALIAHVLDEWPELAEPFYRLVDKTRKPSLRVTEI